MALGMRSACPLREEELVAGPTGFEPAISSVTGWHVWPLHHGPAEVARWRSIA
jgi:hypothetical protein